MLPEHVVDKLKYFNSSKYIVENGKVELKEKKKEGKVHLICKLKNCKFLFELDLDDKWILGHAEFRNSF